MLLAGQPCCSPGFYLTTTSNCPGTAAIYIDDVSLACALDAACCATPAPASIVSACCPEGSTLVPHGSCERQDRVRTWQLFSSNCRSGRAQGTRCCKLKTVPQQATQLPAPCCEAGFAVIDTANECPGSAAIATSSCSDGRFCCSAPAQPTSPQPAAAPAPLRSESCCANGFQLVDTSSECPGSAAIATSSCNDGKFCCSI